MRKTKHDYSEAGSFSRLQEAAIAVADADDDLDYEAACARLKNAARAWVSSHPNMSEIGAIIATTSPK